MNTQETIVKQLKDGLDMFARTYKQVREDKLDWKAAEGVRTAHEVACESVTMYGFSAHILDTRNFIDYDYDKAYAEHLTLSVEELLQKAQSDVELLYASILAFPTEDLEKEMDLPWGTMSMFDIMCYPYWNTMYHFGQISYIQTMYGDKAMY